MTLKKSFGKVVRTMRSNEVAYNLAVVLDSNTPGGIYEYSSIPTKSR